MAATKDKGPVTDPSSLKKSVQFIVFAPVNSDPDDDANRIYMVCPATLKVVEVIEKYDEEAVKYLSALGKKFKKSEIPPKEFNSDLTEEFDGEIEVAGEVHEEANEILEEDESLTSLEEELDDDLVTFVGKGLDEIFPTEDEDIKNVSEVDMADAISLLDQEDDDADLKGLTDFVDDDELPEL